jgi:hypothetical protein
MLASTTQALSAFNAWALGAGLEVSLNAGIMQAASMGVAALCSTWVVKAALTGGLYAMRYFVGLSFWNNQVDFNVSDNNPLPRLPVVTEITEARLLVKEAVRYAHSEKHITQFAKNGTKQALADLEEADARFDTLPVKMAAVITPKFNKDKAPKPHDNGAKTPGRTPYKRKAKGY